MILLGRAPLQAILNLFDPPDVSAGRFAHERASPFHLLNEVMSDVPELGGEVLMNIENVHFISHSSLATGRSSLFRRLIILATSEMTSQTPDKGRVLSICGRGGRICTKQLKRAIRLSILNLSAESRPGLRPPGHRS
jgi:hypothetical protein